MLMPAGGRLGFEAVNGDWRLSRIDTKYTSNRCFIERRKSTAHRQECAAFPLRPYQ
jgi:hypothetical protein